jgi:Raf kinase inhibitor-like YbhB/YbcL family protein
MALRPRALTIVAIAAIAAGVGGVALSANAATTDPLISKNKPVATSSVENSTLTGAKAVDGNTATRWGSLEGKDPQWIRVDLGASFHLSQVILRWEAAYGVAYRIQVSEDDTNWQDAFSTTTGNGGVDTLALNANGRYVRMYGTKRGTPYGYSLFEFEVYGANGGPVDKTPPTPPTNFHQVGTATPTSINVAWSAATDNVGVQLYELYNGGTKIKTVGGNQLSTTLDNLIPNTLYDLVVNARDAAGNLSQASNAVEVTTPPSGEKNPPSVPTGLHSTSADSGSVTLAWTASTDDTGVKDYDVYRDGVLVIPHVPDTTATDSPLQPNTTYSYQVLARDVNDNVSAKGAAISVKTTASGGGGNPIFDKQITTLDLPWGIDFLPDHSALVTERDRFEVVQVQLNGAKKVIGKVPGAVTTGGEGGVLGLAVSPTYSTDHFVFIFHTASQDNRIDRFVFNNGVLSNQTPIVTGIAKNRFHNGGRLRFGPDGFLYATTGDAKNGSNAQNKSSLNGKILRMDKNGKPAPGNPFGTLIYSYGHRNVQGIAWDSRGQLWESEFGEGNLDELNLIKPGKNYGWPMCEGPCSVAGTTNPIRTWNVAAASPSGLEIVNNTLYMAAVRGEQLWVMNINAAGTGTDTPRAFFTHKWGRLRTVIKTPDGGLWLTSTNNDKNGGTPGTIDNVIVRLKFAATTPKFALTSTAFANNGTIPLKYTCQQDHKAGNDISPPLAWGAASGSPKSYAIVLVDTGNGNKHWAIWDIAPSRLSLPEGLGAGFSVPGVSPAHQRALGSGAQTTQYFGPCPGGSTHKYVFTLYALNVTTLPGLTSSSSVAAVESAAKAHQIATTTLSGNSAAHT